MNAIQRSKGKNRGMVAVETALCLPIMLLFVFGIMEFGHAMLCQHLLSNASRLGARQAMLEHSTNAAVTQTTKQFCASSLGVSPEDVTCVILVNDKDGATVGGNNLANAEPGDLCTVTVSLGYDRVALFPASYLNGMQINKSFMLEHE